MGASAPAMLDMSIAPFEAQKRAENLGIAETASVVFAANYEGGTDLPQNTDTCVSAQREGTDNAYSVTCTHGTGKYVQSVTRAFRLAVPDQELDDNGNTIATRKFAYETPTRYSGHQCPTYDKWGGVHGHNYTFYQLHGGACIPNVVWTQTSYILSNPDAWLYDINNYNGFGIHPDY